MSSIYGIVCPFRPWISVAWVCHILSDYPFKCLTGKVIVKKWSRITLGSLWLVVKSCSIVSLYGAGSITILTFFMCTMCLLCIVMFYFACSIWPLPCFLLLDTAAKAWGDYWHHGRLWGTWNSCTNWSFHWRRKIHGDPRWTWGCHPRKEGTFLLKETVCEPSMLCAFSVTLMLALANKLN